jgi:hypothetical protein
MYIDIISNDGHKFTWNNVIFFEVVIDNDNEKKLKIVWYTKEMVKMTDFVYFSDFKTFRIGNYKLFGYH